MDLPAEVLNLIIVNLGYAGLAKLSLVSRSLCNLAQPRLFRSVTIDRASAKSLVDARRPGQTVSHGLTLLANNTKRLVLTVFAGPEDEVEVVCKETEALLRIISSCTGDRMQSLDIAFTEICGLGYFEENIAGAVTRAGYRCKRLTAAGCTWRFIMVMLMCMGPTLRHLDWDYDVYSQPGYGTGEFWSPDIQLPNLNSLSIVGVDSVF